MKCPKCETVNPAGSKFCRECATPLPSYEEPQISVTRTLETSGEELPRGTVFAGRYEIIEELGSGGMGKVYRVHDTKLNEEVALKLIKPEIAAEKRVVERFHNEIKVARKIGHKNVCRIHDLHEEGRTLYLTMEYIRGEDLKSFIKRSKILSAGTALSITHQVAEGLAEAHMLGIVHRDLKPGNVMIDKEGQAKIMDFGIARALSEKGITGAGAMIGTPEYMSPEQVEGKPADARSDLYALGIILFEMVTGRVPFEGETPFSIANKHKSEPPPVPKKLAPQIPEGLNKLILRCLEKEREKRYQTAEDLLADLSAVEEALPTAERVTPRRKTITRREITVKFEPRRLIIPAAAILVLVAAGFFLWHPWSREGGPPALPSDRPSIAILPLANRTGQKDFDQYRDVLSMSMSDRLSQSKYLYVVQPDQVASILSRLGIQEAETFTRENLRAIGRRGVAKYIATGYYTKAGERFLVRVTIQEAESGKVIGTQEVQGESIDKLFLMLDELVLKIKPNLEMTAVEVASDIDGRYFRVMTSSLEAYNYYAQGQKFVAAGKWPEAIEMMKKAVTIDAEFAMAYRTLAALYGNVGDGTEARKNLDKALELANRLNLPPREKLTIEASAKTDIKEELAAYTRLLELYPDDLVGNNLMGLMYLGGLEEYEKAAAHFQIPVRNKVHSEVPYGNLAWAYCILGRYAEAEEVLKEYIRGIQDVAAAHEDLAPVYTSEANYGRAWAELEKAAKLDPSQTDEITVLKIVLWHLQGDFDKAEAEVRNSLSDADAGKKLTMFSDHLFPLFRTQGKFVKAKEILNEGITLAVEANLPRSLRNFNLFLVDLFHITGDIEAEETLLSEVWKQAEAQGQKPGANLDFLVRRADLLISKKSFEDARADSSAIASIVEKSMNRKLMRYPLYLEGKIESEMGSQGRAIELLSKAKSLLPPGQGEFTEEHAFFVDSLALACFRAGDLERARQEYESIGRMTFGRYGYGDIYAKSFYMLGQVHERSGNKKQARANYRAFLDLWKDADPGQPEVEDARNRLARL